MEELEKKLKDALLDPQKSIEVSQELATNWLGKFHERADDLRVEVAKLKVKMKEENPKMSMAEIDTRIEATPMFRDYLRAKHQVERCEELIKVGKIAARSGMGY